MKRSIGVLFFVTIMFCAQSHAAIEAFGYGETRGEAQAAALEAAKEIANSRGTCLEGPSGCVKLDDGTYKCGHYAASHRGTCGKDASDLNTLSETVKKFR